METLLPRIDPQHPMGDLMDSAYNQYLTRLMRAIFLLSFSNKCARDNRYLGDFLLFLPLGDCLGCASGISMAV